jgi:hypothetical protein
MFRLILCSFFLISLSVASQQKKSLEATRIENAPKIDGILDDNIWQALPAYGDFAMYEPGNEGTIDPKYRTEVKMAYDDKAVYVAAYLYHPEPDKILSQFSQRDEVFVQADYFMISLNTYNDGINETRFYVTSAGTIGDSQAERDRSDFGYNVVFDCKISKDDKAWYAEFKIPYNALRFPEVDVQNWGVQFYRKLVAENQTHTWNFIDRTTGNPSQYSGNITGVKNIDPPIRLTLFPFGQAVISDFDGETETDFSAGLDVKYGLSDSFTLDATLIPDFGQAAFDPVSLNLGPFEQTFGENRAFFTEGTDLFNKGRIFFSRRIGSNPTGPLEGINENETFTKFPARINLLNAIKISGRTKGKLGVGFLNAVTERTFATAEDTITGISRKIEIEPLSNYNIIVLDQQFNNNSSVSLINSNVTRNGSYRDANVTGLTFDIADKQNKFRYSGRGIYSNVYENKSHIEGIRTELDIMRIKGKLRYRVGHDFADRNFDINDLGVNFTNNFNNFVAGVSYEIFEPVKAFNKYRVSFSARHRRLYRPSVVTGNNFDFNTFFVLPSRFAFGSNIGFNTENDDYFEPRVEGRFVTYSSSLGGRIWCSSDYRKRFAYDLGFGHRTWFGDPQVAYFADFSPRYRFSDKFLVVLSTDINFNEDQFGYISNTEAEIFFGQRDITRVTNSIQGSYNFDPFKAIDLRFRNSWSTADYSDDVFFILNEDGSRSRVNYDTTDNDPNRNFNIWNLDLSFRWRFAPGSEATFLYRNQIFNLDNMATLGYTESLSNLFDKAQQNSFSLRITYFIDYNNVKDIFNEDS